MVELLQQPSQLLPDRFSKSCSDLLDMILFVSVKVSLILLSGNHPYLDPETSENVHGGGSIIIINREKRRGGNLRKTQGRRRWNWGQIALCGALLVSGPSLIRLLFFLWEPDLKGDLEGLL